MSALVGALLIASAVALVAWTIVSRFGAPVSATPGVEIEARPRRVTAKRREALVEAAGLVHGSDRELAQLARTQTILIVVLGGVAGVLLLSAPSTTTFLAAIPMVMIGWKAPLMVVRSRETKRRSEVDVELVDALGEMVMGVEAGLTLDVVMMRYAQRRETPLADEFRHFLDRIQLGEPRALALADIADRTPTPIVRMFVAALIQNQKLGTPLASVLRQQASTARRQRRQAVEEKAAKVPMKMIFPTVFCILPVLMIVVVGPAIIRLVSVLP